MEWAGLAALLLFLGWAARKIDNAEADRWHDTHELLKAIAHRLERLDSIDRTVADLEDRQRRMAGEESRDERSARLLRLAEERERSLRG